MAVQSDESLKVLESDILEDGSSYEFFQAYRLLQTINDSYPTSSRRAPRTITVRPDLNLGYAEADISEVKELDKQRGYEIISQLAGLYGVASPLPDFYSEELLDNEWDDLHAPREFLDLIHKQLFPKLYHAWTLYKLNFNAFEKRHNSYWDLLYSLLGETDSESDTEELRRIKLRYFNLYSNKERSKDGLQRLLTDYLELEDVEIEEFCQQTVSIPEHLRCRLGSHNHQLGEAHIGNQIVDQRYSIRVHTGELSQSRYEELTSGTHRMNILRELIRSYLKQPLQVSIVFCIRPEQDQLILGQYWHQLGVDSRLSAPLSGSAEKTREVVMPLL